MPRAKPGWTLLLLVMAGAANAALPPQYLSVPQFDRCLATQDHGSYQSLCMPAKRPKACPADSWAQLSALTGAQRVPACEASTPAPR